ncbi:MAG: RNA polymerase sigma factor [Actinomycetota bacterium]
MSRIDALVVEHGDAVYRLARSVVRDPALAEDVTQDTMIRVWERLDTFRGDGSVRGWILRIAHNTAIATLRRVRDQATDPNLLPDRAEAIGVARRVEGYLAVDELDEALGRLDDISRSLVVLREVEGLSYQEIADVLEISVPAVRTRLMRARRVLTDVLEGWRP